jgi:hypothetical protein
MSIACSSRKHEGLTKNTNVFLVQEDIVAFVDPSCLRDMPSFEQPETSGKTLIG